MLIMMCHQLPDNGETNHEQQASHGRENDMRCMPEALQEHPQLEKILGAHINIISI